MKRFIVFIVLAVLIIFALSRGNSFNAYAGNYDFTGASNLSLKLNKDDSFILFYEAGKGSEYIKGKYKIEDNNITLTPNENNKYKFIANALHGKVEGKRIRVVELSGDFIEY